MTKLKRVVPSGGLNSAADANVGSASKNETDAAAIARRHICFLVLTIHI